MGKMGSNRLEMDRTGLDQVRHGRGWHYMYQKWLKWGKMGEKWAKLGQKCVQMVDNALEI